MARFYRRRSDGEWTADYNEALTWAAAGYSVSIYEKIGRVDDV